MLLLEKYVNQIHQLIRSRYKRAYHHWLTPSRIDDHNKEFYMPKTAYKTLQTCRELLIWGKKMYKMIHYRGRCVVSRYLASGSTASSRHRKWGPLKLVSGGGVCVRLGSNVKPKLSSLSLQEIPVCRRVLLSSLTFFPWSRTPIRIPPWRKAVTASITVCCIRINK